jgi:hypothetical protein
MWDNWIGQRIRQSNRRVLVWGLILCAIGLGVAFLYRYVIFNLFAGPFHVDEETLASIRRPGDVSRYFITFEMKKWVRTDVTVATNKDPKPFAEYVLVRVKDRYLIVRRYVSQQGDTVTGTLAAPNAEEQQKVFDSLIKQVPDFEKTLLPVVLDANKAKFYMEAIGLLVLPLVPLAFGIWLTLRALRRAWQPDRHPIARALVRFGTPHEVAESIEQEGGPLLRVGPVEFHGCWLLCRTLGQGCKVFRVEDLVWVYKLIMRINGVPGYWAKLYDRHGESFQVGDSEKRVDAILIGVAGLAPWLIAGYDSMLEEHWKNNPANLIEAVEERKRRYLEAQNQPAEPSSPETGIRQGPEDGG